MRAFKLFRVDRKGFLHSLFIGKRATLPIGQWLQSESLPTPGFALRPGWHCCSEQSAPHLQLDPRGDMPRVWAEVEIADYDEHTRPAGQGGLWYTARRMRIVRVIPRAGVCIDSSYNSFCDDCPATPDSPDYAECVA